MKKKVAATAQAPKIKWEEVSPRRAAAYLEQNATNRPLRESTVKAYEGDMRAGNWIPTHQGIAFNLKDELIDGQHRLTAIVRAGVTVRLLVTRGLPAIVGDNHTMDAVDRGAARSIADQLKLQHGFRNPFRDVAASTAICNLALASGRVRRSTVAQTLKVLDIYGRHISEIGNPVDASKDKRLRRSQLVGALAFARAVHPREVDAFLAGMITGAGLEKDSPLLALRNFIFSDASVAWSSSGSRDQRTAIAYVILNSLWQYISGEKATKVFEGRAGFIFFAERQRESLTKLAAIFGGAVASLETKTERQPTRPVALPSNAPRHVRSAADVTLTPFAESLLRGKDMSDRIHRKVERVAIG